MKKVRVALLAALVFSLVVLAVLWRFTGWVVWLKTGVTIAAGFFAAAVAALFVATLFKTKGGDLWDTGYFRYMRCFWGEKWGGRGDLMQINICRATWLSAITFGMWVFTVGLAGYLVYFFIVGTISGFEVISPLWDVKISLGTNLFLNIFFTGFMGLFCLTVLTVLVFLRDPFEIVLPKFYNAVLMTLRILMVFSLTMMLIVVPIKYAGVGKYSICIGIVVGSIGVTIGIILLIKKGTPGLLKFFARETVPEALVSARIKRWRQKICPLIIQEPPKKDV